MSDDPVDIQLKLDPWGASSLLQKAIRRGEVGLAKHAARTLYGYRGAAVFRRLAVIAVEDIGIADPGLLHDVSTIASDKRLRSVIGSDTAIIDDLVARMARAVKDRSADYLYSCATLSADAQKEIASLRSRSPDQLIAISADVDRPMVRRAVAALLACTEKRGSKTVIGGQRAQQLVGTIREKRGPVSMAVLTLARAQLHPFCLLLPIISSCWSADHAGPVTIEEQLPSSERARGIPLYTWDKHTAVGKQAIAAFAYQHAATQAALRQWVPQHRWAEVVAIAAFYADAAPVRRRLNWPTGSSLQRLGLMADMVNAGCATDGVETIINFVRDELPHLNQLRRTLLRQL